jgi:hypothetical protein
MAKVTIVFEDVDGELKLGTHFEPTPNLGDPDSFTDAQDAAISALNFLMGEAEGVTSINIRRSQGD